MGDATQGADGGTRFWPVEVRLKTDERRLEIEFDNGRTFSYPAEYLRVLSPSAEVQGHGPGQEVTQWGKKHVGILKLEPVGHYAMRIHFDDLHDTGIYTWSYLYELGEDHDRLWADYLAQLEAKGLSREPRGR
ncbi:gamma-butyrobetaine hydroxylase-like domain-containing protein [Azospirillum sp. ST 5-10]|uniref:gamma-butyrobetaine hydroxylase-like domain-containing protein n=1 Tax=unclassified Azospirillum TaxID=2630922 RepID=UPI003F49FD94